jgi:hypothetical protein
LFFECAVAAQLWCVFSEILEVNLGGSFESIGQFWLSNKRHVLMKIITAGTLLSLWKLRNDLCFQNTRWKGMDILLNIVPREQEGFPVKNSAGDQEESFYSVVASSLKMAVGLGILWRSCKWWTECRVS